MKIAIAGFGVEGRENYRYFRELHPDADFAIIDDRGLIDDLPEGAEHLTYRSFLDSGQQFDLILRSPSFPPDSFSHTRSKVWSATNEFFEKCPAPIIGVTGTKGKGTTCSLITAILRVAGKTVHLVGNIGVPALSVLPDVKPDDIVVYELSSFQLWDIEKSPHIAVVLMIEPDHLDIHRNFEDYVGAKSNIAKYQNSEDRVIYHPTNKYARQIAMSGNAKRQRYGVHEDGGVFVKDDTFFVKENTICGVDTLHIAGVHNLENACAAISAAFAVVSELTNRQIAEGLRSFDGLPHRLKYVAEVDGVKYYDDSIATTPGSAISALRSFDEPKTIILGGYDKGANYTELVRVCRETGTKVIAIGSNRVKIVGLCQEAGVDVFEVVGDMLDIVSQAKQVTPIGGVVVLSPAAASFDMFTSYEDRGDQFVKAIEKLMEKEGK